MIGSERLEQILSAPRAHRLAAAVLAGAVALAAAHFFVARQLERPPLLALAPLALALSLVASFRLPMRRRVQLAAAIVLALLGLYSVEILAGRSEPRDGTAASRRGQSFDTRTRWEVVRDHRRAGRAVVSSVQPRDLLVTALALDGAPAIPLGGISSSTTVFCNEGGAYAEYESDERGFNNPRGLWESDRIDVAVVGEAFAQGACVPRGAGAIDLIRARHPATLNLAMAGNGPLFELAGIEEHLAELKPRIVLWFHYGKDLGNLDAERVSLLRRYLEPGHRQGLAAKQAQIDRGLAEIAKSREERARAFPTSLVSIGLTRQSTPIWLQDLILGEQHSSVSVALRLDRLSGAVAARLTASEPAGPPIDFALYRTILERARATVASWGGALHFVYLADVHHLRGREHPSRAPVLEIVKQLGLPLIDLQPVFAAAPDPSKLRYHEQSHLNEAGYRLVAEAVLAALPAPR